MNNTNQNASGTQSNQNQNKPGTSGYDTKKTSSNMYSGQDVNLKEKILQQAQQLEQLLSQCSSEQIEGSEFSEVVDCIERLHDKVSAGSFEARGNLGRSSGKDYSDKQSSSSFEAGE